MRLLLHLSRGSLFLHTSGRFSSPKRRKNSASPISNILGGSTPAFEMNGSKLGKFSSSKDMQRNVAFVSFFFRAQKTKKKREKLWMRTWPAVPSARTHIHTWFNTLSPAHTPLFCGTGPMPLFSLLAPRKVTTPATHLSFRLLHFGPHWATTNGQSSFHPLAFRMRDGQPIGKRTNWSDQERQPAHGHFTFFSPRLVLKYSQGGYTQLFPMA